MKRMERKAGKEKNAGFSLVEILVAVVILAIIVVPLLHGFVSSARTNAKARDVLRATTAGQNIMEEIKASSAEEILSDPVNVSKKEYTSDVTGEKQYTYERSYKNIMIDGNAYDVYAKLDPIEWFGAFSALHEITEYNSKEFTELYDMNAVCNACYIQEKDMDSDMAKQFTGSRLADVKKGMERSILVDISETLGKQTVNVTVEYSYLGKKKYASPQNQCIYSNDGTGEALRNVYILFQPMYNGTHTDVKEHITVRNLANLPVSVYFVRQSLGLAESEAERQARESNYCVNVNILEKDRADASYFDAGGKLKVLTQVRSNLPEKGDLSASPVIYQQMNLKYGVTETDYDSSKRILSGGVEKIKTAAELTDFKDLSAASAKERVYKVKVDVYGKGGKENGSKALVSLQGAKEE